MNQSVRAALEPVGEVLLGEGDAEFGISRGRLMPAHRILDPEEVPEEARRKLQEAGIAPPHPSPGEGTQAQPVTLHRRRETVRCPRCGSLRTVELARFGSTACKAQYRCTDCLEPFDYFKPH